MHRRDAGVARGVVVEQSPPGPGRHAWASRVPGRISIPSKADAFFHYECGRETESEFLLSHLLLASKGVPRDGGEKVTLRTNSEGMLSIQHQVRTADQGPTCTVEFICLPLIEDMA
eukprot:EG_transcript_30107